MNPPPHELSRSPAAARVGALADQSGLFFSHFEHTVRLPEPEDWTPARADVGRPTGWKGGVLAEVKFRDFRLDRMVGSFHPGHRAKWTAHELCHRLVGFAWRPGASPFFHATAARLAEALPVALWYFLDEAGLHRCPDHDGPLFGATCAACDQAARQPGRDDDPEAERWYDDGLRFLDRERAAIARSRAEGRPIPHRFATLELCSDGLAYVAAHRARLQDPLMEEWIARFFPPDTGCHPSLEALDARMMEVAHALVGRGDARPWPVDRWRWIAQDLAWRLMVVRAQATGEVVTALDTVITKLEPAQEAAITAAISAYGELAQEWEVPAPDEMLAVGYDLPGGFGRSIPQLRAGLKTVCPRALTALGKAQGATIAAFVAADMAVRAPLGRRFADWLTTNLPGHAATELAHAEATLVHRAPPDAAALTLGADGATALRLSPDATLLTLTTPEAARAWADQPPPVEVAIWTGPDGKPTAAELEPATAAALRQRPIGGALDEETRDALIAVGLLVGTRWELG